MSEAKDQQKYAIRFGLGAIKAVGFNMMEKVVNERQENGNFKDIYDFAERLDPKLINKKSLEALAKSGSFDEIHNNRCQIAESFDIISSYSAEKKEEANSNQMSLFGGLPEANLKPELKKVSDWDKEHRLQKEFEAFGFFLTKHPLDEKLEGLKKRGVVFSTKIERAEFEDGSLVKMAGVVASSKHRSGSRGRFAYVNISDPYGIFEAMIFDEELINSSRDLLADGSVICLECLIRKDEGGIRVLVRDLKKLDDFMAATPESDKEFEDIKIKKMRKFNRDKNDENKGNSAGPNQTDQNNQNPFNAPVKPQIDPSDIFKQVEVIIENRDAIFNLKAFLSSITASIEAEHFSQVSIYVSKKSPARIALPGKYIFTKEKISKLETITGIKSVEANK